MLLKDKSLGQLPVLTSLLKLSDQPIMIFDRDWCLSGYSKRTESFFPLVKPGQSIGIFFPESESELKKSFSELRPSENSNTEEISPFFKNSQISWRCSCVLDEVGNILGFAIAGKDLSAVDKLEQDLKLSMKQVKDQKRALDESSIVAVTDHRGIIQYVNDTFCRISGYEREELLGKTHAIIKSGHHTAEFFKNLWTTISSGKVWKGEIKNKSKSGDYYWVDTTIVPFLNEQGRPYQFIAIRSDISEKKGMQEKIENERLRMHHAEKLASLGELAAGIAHELGNPAASINAWLDVIELQHERKMLDIEFFAKMIPKVRRDAVRIREIIRGMLAFARDGSRDPFQSENPLLLVNQVVESCTFKAKKMNIELKIDIKNPYMSFECRSTEISQLLINLIQNGCDAVQSLDERWVEIQVEEKNESIEFRIRDSGHGIATDLIREIFNPFFTTKAVGQGTGLGLSIAKSIVENHKGTIVVDKHSRHTTIVVCIPKRQSNPDGY